MVIQTSEAQKQGRVSDVREIVNIAASLAKKRERVQNAIPILDICYLPKLGIYVAVYEAQKRDVRMASPGVRGRKGSEK